MSRSSRDHQIAASREQDEPAKRKVAVHRQRLRAQGLRPIQIWVPDVRSAAFREQAQRQSAAVSASGHGADDQAFIDSVSVVLNDAPDNG